MDYTWLYVIVLQYLPLFKEIPSNIFRLICSVEVSLMAKQLIHGILYHLIVWLQAQHKREIAFITFSQST